MATTRLSQIGTSYVAGGVTYTKGEELTGKTYQTPYYVLSGTGTPIERFNSAHITIWGGGGRRRNRDLLATVEFTWAGAKHLEYSLRTKRISQRYLNSGDASDASAGEDLLIAFLVNSMIGDTSTIIRSCAQPVVKPAATIAQVMPSLKDEDEFPPLGGKR